MGTGRHIDGNQSIFAVAVDPDIAVSKLHSPVKVQMVSNRLHFENRETLGGPKHIAAQA